MFRRWSGFAVLLLMSSAMLSACSFQNNQTPSHSLSKEEQAKMSELADKQQPRGPYSEDMKKAISAIFNDRRVQLFMGEFKDPHAEWVVDFESKDGSGNPAPENGVWKTRLLKNGIATASISVSGQDFKVLDIQKLTQ